ncbi:MAG: alginate lyase family protein [Acidobacteriota bacterium]
MKRISDMREKVRGMTPGEIAGEVILRLRRKLKRSINRDRLERAYLSDSELQQSLRKPFVDVAERIRCGKRAHLTEGLKDPQRTAAIVRQLFPGSIAETIGAADEILHHRIRVFERAIDFSDEIDWLADPFTGVRWPLAHFSRLQIVRGDGSDARVAWELNRLHHLTTLGRAYLFTGDERYTEEFLRQIVSWNEANPPRFGINWANAMEAAIRAVNLLAAIEMFRHSPLLTDERIALPLKMLVSHGRYIRANLEFSYRTPSNHYLSDLIGLLAIGATMPDLKASPRWMKFSAAKLRFELMRQTHADGVSYEGSVGYHRLATEILALFFMLSKTTRISFPLTHRHRLEAMFRFAAHYIKPDLTAPMIGDSDDGRLMRFKDRAAADHSYLLSLGAALFDRSEFKRSARIDEEALWWAGEKGLDQFNSLAESAAPSSRAFPNAQIFIQRQGAFYSIIDCGDHGIRGRGSHAHSDAMSIEVFAFDKTFLRDPGTFAYTGNAEMRNLFRSTAYHNTVRIDGRDISQIDENQPFALGKNVCPKIIRWKSDDLRDALEAEHHAYADIKVIHRRAVTFDKRQIYWLIADSFAGEGRHTFEFFFNFDAGLEVKLSDDNRAIAFSPEAGLVIAMISGHAMEVERVDRFVSLSYGNRAAASGIIYRFHASVPFENKTLLVPFRRGDESKVERIFSEEACGAIC